MVSRNCKDVAVLVGLGALMVGFALGSWVTVNGIFSELPVLMGLLPEGYALASYLTVAVQVANVFLIAYLLYLYCVRPVQEREAFFVSIVLFTGVLSMVLLALFWDGTAYVGQAQHSVALIVLTIIAGAASCTSSLVFLPIIALYPPSFAIAFAAGEAATGLLSAIIAVIQQTLHFSPSIYFSCLAVCVTLSWLCYVALRLLPKGKEIRAKSDIPKSSSLSQSSDDTPLIPDGKTSSSSQSLPQSSNVRPWLTLPSSPSHFLWSDLIITIVLNVCENAALPSCLPYALAPPFQPSLYRWAIWSGMIAAPLGSSLSSVSALTTHPVLPLGIGFALSSLIVVSSVMRPVVSWMGPVLVTSYIVARLLLGYTKAIVYLRVQLTHGGPMSVAVAQQVGGVIGALTFFLLINFTSMYSGSW